MTLVISFVIASGISGLLAAQDAPPQAAAPRYKVSPGMKIPLNLMNTVSTKQAAVGNRIYLETMYRFWSTGRLSFPQAATSPAP
jgi:hypothetical protein